MNRILIIHRGSLGDFLLLIPSIALLRKIFPGARLEALGHPEILSVVCPGLIDSTLPVESSLFVPIFENTNNVSPKAAELLASTDMLLAFVNDSNGILRRNIERLGVRHILITPPFPPEGMRVHVAKYLYQATSSFLEKAFFLTDFPAFCSNVKNVLLQFPEDEVCQVKLCYKSILSGVAPIAIHPGSGSERKCWPLEHFEALAERLLNGGQRIVWLLGPADRRLARHLARLAEKLNVPLLDSLPLRYLAILLSKCAAYVGNDSGITHVAALAGIPTVAIFGPTDASVWGPVGASVAIMKSNAACSPCARPRMYECETRQCLETIADGAVGEKILEVLQKVE